VLIEAFRRGQDSHSRTASELFDVAPDQITKGQRATAKTINFGVLYGMGPFRLSRELQIPRTEAKAFIERYFERLEGVNAFLDGLVVQARERGFAETLLGRRRPLPELASRNQGVRAQGERLAVNTPIQGTAADIIKVAMVRVERRLRERDIDAAMLLQVHDELLFEVSAEHLPPLRELVVAEMEGAMELAVPLRVDARDGANWAEL
jgi:DNA polymerase-1